jgi:hypothetical protein
MNKFTVDAGISFAIQRSAREPGNTIRVYSSEETGRVYVRGENDIEELGVQPLPADAKSVFEALGGAKE